MTFKGDMETSDSINHTPSYPGDAWRQLASESQNIPSVNDIDPSPKLISWLSGFEIVDKTKDTNPKLDATELKKEIASLKEFYSKNITEPARIERFEKRMTALAQEDPQLVKQFAAITKEFSQHKDPASLGKNLAEAMTDHFDRTVGKNGRIDFDDPFNAENVFGGFSGIMVSANKSELADMEMVKSFNDTIAKLDGKRYHNVQVPNADKSLYAIVEDSGVRVVVVTNLHQSK